MGINDLPRTIELDSTGCSVRIIDQSKLPYEQSTITITTWQRLVEAIQRLEIRGAPALGAAGAAALCLFAHNQWRLSPTCLDELSRVAEQIARARPTAVNLSWGVIRAESAARRALIENQKDRNSQAEKDQDTLIDDGTIKAICSAIKHETEAIIVEDELSCRKIGANGATLLSFGTRILTHCNAGSLATAFYGTALGVIYSAFEQGKISRVYIDETRPIGQGARLTAWELAKVGIPSTLICDNMAASLMHEHKIDAVIVGADRICANGDAANKIGTYGLAVLAHHHHIPFYIAAPLSTIDWKLADGSAITIEHRNAEEILEYPIPGIEIYNPAFDVTPPELITAYITEAGVVDPNTFQTLKGASAHCFSSNPNMSTRH